MKHLLNKLIVMVLGVMMLFTVSLVSVHASEATTLIINYYRFDEDYSSWNLWLWQNQPTSEAGQAHNFNDTHETGATRFEYDLEGSYLEEATEVGFIVRKGAWESREPGGDRYIDMSNPNAAGEVEVFIITEDTNVYYDLDDIDLSDRVLRADFYDTDELQFDATSLSIDHNQIKVFENDHELSIDTIDQDAFQYTVHLDDAIDLTNSYHLEVDFEDGDGFKTYEIGFIGIYNSDAFNDAYYYDGELGAIYTEEETTFKLWAPISSNVTLKLYEKGHDADMESFDGTPGVDEAFETHEMSYKDRGVWEVSVSGDLHGVYYTYVVTNGAQTHEVVDPYTRSTGVNGLRGMVVDFDRLNPTGWTYDRPDNITHKTDAIIYEAHIRDYTSHETWNGTEAWRGKYLGFAEPGTTYEGVHTGFDHLRDLGITHVQLLPVHDIGMAIDETKIEDEDYKGVQDTIFNWGYMTLHFNTLEGSYATDPYDGSVRINEFKRMVQKFHDANMRIVLDVVYNHTATSDDSNFQKIVPGYYFRFDDEGNFSNGSGTGNETASEHQMMRKFMVDSVVFWAEEYNVSGYRFDLMRLHDVETMQAIEEALHAIDETFLVFGEPWDAGGSELDAELAADKTNMDQMFGIGAFNDDIRDGIRGGVFNADDAGWVQGVGGNVHSVRMGIVGAIPHPDTAFDWALEPYQSVSYVSAHDNNTLHDKLQLSTEDADFETIKAMQKLSNAIVLTAQGMPFLHGGVELMRTKPCTVVDGEAQGECDADLRYDHNSYRSPDATNQIDWNWKVDNYDVFEYYQGLIKLRRHTDVFNMETAQEVRDNLFFISDGQGFIAYMIDHPDSAWDYTLVAHNNTGSSRSLDLFNMEWQMVVNKDQAGTDIIETLSGNSIDVSAHETVVLFNLSSGAEWPVEREIDTLDPSVALPVHEEETALPSSNATTILVTTAITVVILGAAGLTIFILSKKAS